MGSFDVVVVGCGAMGSSTSYSLADRGLKVLDLERFSLNHDRGSSHGRTRIIRMAYYEDPRYVPLLRRAYDSWRELEAKSGKKLMQTTGGLMIGEPDGELVKGVMESVKEHGLRHSVLTAKEAQERYPAFSLGEEYSVVHEEAAGVLFAEESIKTFVDEARASGAVFEFNNPATSWQSSREGIEVEAGGVRHRADKMVVCAGGWTSSFLGSQVVPLTCERQVPMWFSSGGRPEFQAENFPIFIMEEHGRGLFYGIPELGDGVKVAMTHGGRTVLPDDVGRSVEKDDISPVTDFNSRRLRNLRGPPVEAVTCFYANTPDLNFAIGALPSDPRVTVVSACSGHGFKFASVMGEIAADLATDKKTGHDISFLELSRFAAKAD